MLQSNWLDRAVFAVNPTKGIQRMRARTVAAIMDTSHVGASRTKRSLKRWWVRSSKDPDVEVLPELDELRARTRSLYKCNPIARAAINRPLQNIIGSGLKLQSRIDREFLGISDDEADAWESEAERRFGWWANYTDADAERRENFYGLQSLACLSYLQSGEVFALLPLIPRPGTTSSLRVKLVEADRVSNPYNQVDTVAMQSGIVTDSWGAPTAYWIETTPNWLNIKQTWEMVDAFGAQSGRQNVIHLYRQDRPNQRRGVPFLTPVIDTLHQLGDYTDAELMAAVLASYFTVFVKTQTGDTDLLAAAMPNAATNDGQNATDGASADDNDLNLGPGLIQSLGDNEDISIANPGRPNAQFDPFVSALIRQIGMALDIPYEMLILHFSASYSASRAALLEAWKFFSARREWIATKFCQPIYETWLAEMVATGVINAPGFFDDIRIRRAYCGAEWVGPTPGQLDPVKETQAAIMKVDNNLSTKAKETARLDGGSWQSNFRQRGKEKRMEAELDIAPVAPVAPASKSTDEGDKPADGNGTEQE